MELYDDETLTRVNDNIELIQKKQGLTFGTDAYLLSAYIRGMKNGVACDLGCGTGIISMLLAVRGRFSKIIAVDVQEQFCDVARRNVRHNHLDNIEVVCADIRTFDCLADVVFTNPPYMKSDSGRANAAESKNIARHEIRGDINDFTAAASRMLKYGGNFYAVYRPDRLCDLFCAMRSSNIEPKRMTMVYPDADHEPCMVLIQGKKGAAASIITTAPLILRDVIGDTADLKFIYEKGEFGDKFGKR